MIWVWIFAIKDAENIVDYVAEMGEIEQHKNTDITNISSISVESSTSHDIEDDFEK